MPRSFRLGARYDLALVARRRDRPYRGAVALECASPAQAIAAIGEKAITAREVKTAVTGLKAFDIGAVEAAVSKSVGNLPDDEAVASDVLGFLAGIGFRARSRSKPSSSSWKF